eukprot:scaffold12985_cov69-Isochrysis_galbana.AAC.1
MAKSVGRQGETSASLVLEGSEDCFFFLCLPGGFYFSVGLRNQLLMSSRDRRIFFWGGRRWLFFFCRIEARGAAADQFPFRPRTAPLQPPLLVLLQRSPLMPRRQDVVLGRPPPHLHHRGVRVSPRRFQPCQDARRVVPPQHQPRSRAQGEGRVPRAVDVLGRQRGQGRDPLTDVGAVGVARLGRVHRMHHK